VTIGEEGATTGVARWAVVVLAGGKTSGVVAAIV